MEKTASVQTGNKYLTYLLQDATESTAMSVEITELEEELKNAQHKTIDYCRFKSSQFAIMDGTLLPNCVPVGTIEFIQAYLWAAYGINHMNPIEVPPELRLPHLLLRDYRIVPYDQLPREGSYFVKDVSKLKSFTFYGSTDALFREDKFGAQYKKSIDPTHLFQVSDILHIISEYRVIVMQDKIYGIQFYDGDPTVMPTPQEINKIKEMVARYTLNQGRPRAYAMDVAVVKAVNEYGRDLALIEVHPAAAIGTYGCRGAFLPNMYRLGIEWYIKYNTRMRSTV